MLLELFDEPTRIVNADTQATVGCARKVRASMLNSAACAPARAESWLQRRRSIRHSSRFTPDARIGSFEQALNLAEERAHVAMIESCGSIKMEEPARQIVQGQSHLPETAGQFFIDRLQLEALRLPMLGGAR